MDFRTAPTKGNLMSAKNSLKMASKGYELLDRKRTLLIREMSTLHDRAKSIQDKIDTTFKDAYTALQEANITMGIEKVNALSEGVKEDDGIDVKFYSVMGVEIPIVRTSTPSKMTPSMSMYHAGLSIDEARFCFNRAKRLILSLAEVNNGIQRLNINIQKTQKRANALKNIVIPRYEKMIDDITSALEEKEREEFARLKVIKNIVK